MRLPIKVLEGDNVKLQPFSKDFISHEYLKWINDGDINKFIDKAKENTTLDELIFFAEKMINSKFDYFFAIIHKKNQYHVGNVRLGPVDYRYKSSNFGILIGDKNLHGCGIATETIELIKNFSFNYLKLNRLHFPVVRENIAAMKLYAKTNFTNIGEMKKNFNKNGKSWKLVEWSMSNLDYKKEKNG